MRSCENGKRSPRKKTTWPLLGLCLAGLLGLAWSAEIRAETSRPARRGWLFEQWAVPASPTLQGETRHQAGLSVENYGEVFSLQGSALLDFRDFEIGLHASSTGLQTDENRTFGLQVARYFVTKERTYGRLGVEYVASLHRESWTRFALSSGILDTPQLPWSVQLHADFFLTISKKTANWVVVSGETARVFPLKNANTLSFGAQLNWIYDTGGGSSGEPGLYEHMLFSFGPTVEWRGALGRVRLFVPTRLWLDYEAIGTASDKTKVPPTPPVITQTGYPSEWPAVPGVVLSWTILI